MTLRGYLETLKNKRAAVICVAVSNLPQVKLLREAGVDVTA